MLNEKSSFSSNTCRVSSAYVLIRFKFRFTESEREPSPKPSKVDKIKVKRKRKKIESEDSKDKDQGSGEKRKKLLKKKARKIESSSEDEEEEKEPKELDKKELEKKEKLSMKQERQLDDAIEAVVRHARALNKKEVEEVIAIRGDHRISERIAFLLNESITTSFVNSSGGNRSVAIARGRNGKRGT